METASEHQSRIVELESLRGLAALLVVIFHMPRWNPSFDVTFTRNGYLMVELFFVLSGFVIYTSYSEKIRSTQDLLQFGVLRIGRLYPVHLLFLFTVALLEGGRALGLQPGLLGGQYRTDHPANTLEALVEQLFLAQAIGPTGNVMTFNAPAWSISVELYTYLFFGLIVLRLAPYRHLVFGTVVLISLVMLVTRHTYGFEFFLRCLAGFFFGCLVARLKETLRIRLPEYSSALAFAAIGAFLAIKTRGRADFFVYFLTGYLILSLVTTRGGLLKQVLRTRPLVWLGTVSYSIYMSHWAVLHLVNTSLRTSLHRPVSVIEGTWTPALTAAEAAAMELACLLLVLLVSAAAFRWVETPCRRISRRIAQRAFGQFRPAVENARGCQAALDSHQRP